ncbi:NADH-quinone oxidoreductase subunit C/D [Dirofilaria immitis]
MCSTWNTFVTSVFFLFITVERSYAALKNQTGEAHYYWGPVGLQQWQVPQGWKSLQNWIVPQSGISSQGWALPPGRTPVTAWAPSPMQPSRPPFLWTFFDDRNVCTLDASILVALESDQSITPVGLDNAQPVSSYYGGDLSSSTVRMPCASIATTSAQACTSCCKMACKHYTISAEDVHGFLISTAKLNGQFSDITFPSVQQAKPQGSPPVLALPLPPVSCVCCGPRHYFTSWSASTFNPPSQQM